MRSVVGAPGRWLLAVILLGAAAFAVTGTFRGRVIDGPTGKKTTPGWLYVESRNHMVRKVEISRATVTYSAEVPQRQRTEPAHRALIQGAEVRVTAEQSDDGEWSATEIEVLQVSPGRQLQSETYPNGSGARMDYKNKPTLGFIQRLIQ